MLAVATHDEATGEIAVFAVNRSLTEPLELSVDLPPRPPTWPSPSTCASPTTTRSPPTPQTTPTGWLPGPAPPPCKAPSSPSSYRPSRGTASALPKGTPHDHAQPVPQLAPLDPARLPRHRPRCRRHRRSRRLRRRLGRRARPGNQAPAGDGGAAGYDGPAVTLTFWNGFTGGDGPIMKKLVQQFSTEHENIKVTMNTLQWADYYAKLPSAVTAGKGPDIAIMHVDSVATNAARRVIQPLDDVASALKLTEADFADGALAGRHLPGQALRHPARRPPARVLLQQDGDGEGGSGSGEAADQCRGVRDGAGHHEEQGHPGRLGHTVPVHRIDDRAVTALAVRRRALRRRTPAPRPGPTSPA